MTSTERVPGERRKKFYVALVDEYQRVLERLSPVFNSKELGDGALKSIRERAPKAVLVEETLMRFIHGLG